VFGYFGQTYFGGSPAVAAGGGVTATAAWTEDDDVVAASAAETITSTAAWTEADDQAVAAATQTVTSTAAWTEADDAWVVAAAHDPYAATLAWTETDDAATVAATYVAPPYIPPPPVYLFRTPIRDTQGPRVPVVPNPATEFDQGTRGNVLMRHVVRAGRPPAVLITDGVVTEHPVPTTAQTAAAQSVFLGGHDNTPTQTERDLLVAAGYVVQTI